MQTQTYTLLKTAAVIHRIKTADTMYGMGLSAGDAYYPAPGDKVSPVVVEQPKARHVRPFSILKDSPGLRQIYKRMPRMIRRWAWKHPLGFAATTFGAGVVGANGLWYGGKRMLFPKKTTQPPAQLPTQPPAQNDGTKQNEKKEEGMSIDPYILGGGALAALGLGALLAR